MKRKRSLMLIGSLSLALVFVIGMFGTAFAAPQEEDTQSSVDSLLIRGKCTTLIVGKDATLDSSVFLAHNEDLGGPSTQHLIVVPRIQHEPGEVFELYSGGSIPQAEETYAYIASTIFDMDYIPGTITTGINEYQVSIGNNLAPSREELVPDDKYELKPGGVIWTEFQQIALERAKTAREAVEIMGHLSETCWLSGDPGTAFGIADPNEGWFIEIPREGQWVAKRVPDDGYAMMANCFRIGEIDFEDEENFMYSEDVVNFAVERGWYDLASGEPFNFAETYGDPASAERRSNIRRHWRVESLLAEFAPEITIEDVMSIMRDHYEGTEYDLTKGYEVSPHHTHERSICRTSTEVCIVAQLRNWLPAEIGGVAWWALSAPCSSVFVPWYMGILEVPYEYTIGTDVEDDESAFWAFNRLEGLVDAYYGDLISDVREAWAEFEQEELAIQSTVEEVALEAYYEDSELARQFLTSYSNDLGIRAVNKARRIADELEEYVGEGNTTVELTTDVLPGVVFINVGPTSIDFGELIVGATSETKWLTVENTGNLDVSVTATATSTFYTQALWLNNDLVDDWGTDIVSESSDNVAAKVKIPSNWVAGTETGLLIFWAEVD